jgi:PEP-CTERM/exosortase A-associated glycosyltransferase
MKVLHVLQNSLPSLTGYAIRSNGLMRALKRHGVEIVAMTGAIETRGRSPVEEIEGIRYYRTIQAIPQARTPLREWQLSRILGRRLVEVIAAECPDIVHAHSPVYNGLAALKVARRAGIPCIYEMRAVWEDAAVDQKKFTTSSPIYHAARALETHVLKRAAAAVTICHGLERDVLARGIPRKKLFVAPNGVDADAFRPPPRDEELARSLGLSNRLVFGFIGSLFYYEGVEDLVDAAPAVLAEHPGAGFLVLGGGEREAVIREKIAALNDPRVVYRPRVPHNQVQAYYSIVDCLAYPRLRVRLTELVTPLKPLEAMAMRKTVVASDIGGHRELITNEQTGLLYDVENPRALSGALGRIARDGELAKRLATAGYEYARRERSWARITENHLRAYEFARPDRVTLPREA